MMTINDFISLLQEKYEGNEKILVGSPGEDAYSIIVTTQEKGD